jgi:hypothetical protein
MKAAVGGGGSGRERPSAERRWWLVLVAVAVVYLGFFAVRRGAFFPLGVHTFGPWFLDTFAVLAANDAAAGGLDVHAPNPLDPLQRPHSYSRWWLHLGQLGLTRADTSWMGATLVLAFLGVALARLRPREPREIAWYLVVLCAPSTLLAIERANNDLVIFLLLAPVVPCLLASRAGVRMLPVGLIAVAAGLKYYPAAAGLVLLAGADRGDVVRRLMVAVAVLAAVAFSLADDAARVVRVLPVVDGLTTFGAAFLLNRMGLFGGAALVAGLVVAAVMFAAWWRWSPLRTWNVAPAARAEWLGFVLGAVLLTGCFFTAKNFAYRWVFALWLAPFLWRMMRDVAEPTAVRRLAMVTAVLLVVMLWADPLAGVGLNAAIGWQSPATIIAWADRFFLVGQPFAWAFFACLIGFLTAFLRQCCRGR